MRIGFLVPRNGFGGGLERHAHDLAVSLSGRGHAITLLHGRTMGRDTEVYARPFVEVLPMAEVGRARNELDVIYAQRVSDVGELALLGDVPCAIAVHDHDLTCVRSHRYLPISREPCHRPPGIGCVTHGCCVVRTRRAGALLPVTLRSPFALRRRVRALAERSLLVANSHYVAHQLVRAGVDVGRIHVVYPVPPDDRRPLRPRPAEPRLLVVGQLLPSKGVDIAITALRYLPSRITLTVVGDGPLRRSLAAHAVRVAPGRVEFVGYVRPEEVTRFYDAASVTVVPSRWPEPFGMVGIEAMRRGRPVVGADHGGIPEWLEAGRGGLLFTPGSAQELAAAAVTLLADENAGARALAVARERFPHPKMVDEIEAMLRHVAR